MPCRDAPYPLWVIPIDKENWYQEPCARAASSVRGAFPSARGPPPSGWVYFWGVGHVTRAGTRHTGNRLPSLPRVDKGENVMKRYVLSLIAIGSVVGFVLSNPLVVQAQQSVAGKPVTVDAQHIAVNRQTSVDCNICFTCGGDWPIFAGSIRSNPATPTERGSLCSGALQTRTDSAPFLCCK